MTKVCTKCGAEQPIDSFCKRKASLDGRHVKCRACSKAYKKAAYDADPVKFREIQRTKRKENPLRFRGYELKSHFKITLEQFDRLFELQGRKCAACGATEPKGLRNQWVVDHDHACCPENGKSCGKCIRGILCGPCNAALGICRDNIDTLNNMASYLSSYAAIQEVIQVI